MKTDYKFWYIKRDNDGFITEVAVRFYEGDITTEQERDLNRNMVDVTKYRRNKRLQKIDVPHLIDISVKLEPNGNEAIIYNQRNFGNIKTDIELKSFFNSELAKDKTRIPIDEQK